VAGGALSWDWERTEAKVAPPIEGADLGRMQPRVFRRGFRRWILS
jgi:hypothetical protein